MRADRIGIDPASVVLKVNGVDVTSLSSVVQSSISYPTKLLNGAYSVELTVKDTSGNTVVATW